MSYSGSLLALFANAATILGFSALCTSATRTWRVTRACSRSKAVILALSENKTQKPL